MDVSATTVGPAEINAAISDVVKVMTPDVVRIRFDIGSDWSGDPAIFFRIIMSDEASKVELSDEASKARFRELVTQVVRRLAERLDFSSVGLIPYHNFRSVSEQAVLGEDAWA